MELETQVQTTVKNYLQIQFTIKIYFALLHPYNQKHSLKQWFPKGLHVAVKKVFHVMGKRPLRAVWNKSQPAFFSISIIAPLKLFAFSTLLQNKKTTVQ